MRGLLRWAALTALAAVGAACGGGESGAGDSPSTTTRAQAATTVTTSAPVNIQGLQVVPVPSREHVSGPVLYDRVPPVGGDHAAVWQNCGFYAQPVPSEAAVHSLEHGAIWITHRPDLPTVQVEALRRLASERHVLVSPWSDGSLPAPVVASAWGRQLLLDSASDPRLRGFVDAFRFGSQSPEPGASCSGGNGQPS